MKVIRLVDEHQSENRLVIRFPSDDEIEVEGRASSANLALAAAVLSKLSVDSLEQ